MSELALNYSAARLNMDSLPSQLKEGEVSFAMNGVIAGFDGKTVSYQNEPANKKCAEFPEGFRVVFSYSFIARNEIIFWLTNPQTGVGQIGGVKFNSCTYNKYVESSCFNFSLQKPIT